MKIIKLLVASLAIFTVGASIDPGTVRAETEFDRQMRAAMEAETKALGERIVAGTNPPLTYAQMRILADKLSAKYKAAGKRLNPKELMERTGVECKTQLSGGCPDYLAHIESVFRYFTEPAPVLSDRFKLRYFEANGKPYDIYANPINQDEATIARKRVEEEEAERKMAEAALERARIEAKDREHRRDMRRLRERYNIPD